MEPRVVLSILNWETPELTCRCLQGALALEGVEPWILVVDNGSRDDSVARLRAFVQGQANPRLRLIESPVNLGYAGGNNLAIRHALAELDPHFIWILNSDTLPRPDALRHLLAAARSRPEVAIWGSTLLDATGQRLELAGGCHYHPCLSLHREALAGLPLAELPKARLPRPLDYVAGAAMLVRADCFRRHGLLNEEYFLFFEELDLVRRVGRERIAWCPAAQVLHLGGASMKKRAGLSPLAEYHANLSALRYTWRHHRHCFPFMALFRLGAKSLQHLPPRRWPLYRPLWRAYWDFFRPKRRSARSAP